jgi:site-specific recombinase XerD
MATDLRTKFLNYMTLLRFADHTKRTYVTGVKGLAKYYKQSPATLTNEHIQDYLLYLLKDRKLTWGSVNAYLSGIICFYRGFCKWDETQFQIPPRPSARKLPTVYSKREVRRLLEAADNFKHRLLLETAYSAGLRISELVRLEPHHIESDPDRMLIRVEQGKGKKDRYTILSKKLLEDLRTYFRQYRPGKWLFAGQNPDKHLSEAAARNAFYRAKKKPVSTKAAAFMY